MALVTVSRGAAARVVPDEPRPVENKNGDGGGSWHFRRSEAQEAAATRVVELAEHFQQKSGGQIELV